MATTLFGIVNCDSIKKTQKWLLQNNVSYQFHDYRKNGLSKTLLENILQHINWSELLNKRSTSYRNLSEQQKESINEDTIIDLFIEFPTLIKRPLLVHKNKYLVGFNINAYENLFSK
ncbi:ArsC family reductase [Psychromonas sp. MME2]|uniref:ArsC family reductase n=1 Tax=unclassified Psychromonas TaxID=2614957 RepID=UPI00339CA40D